MKLLKSLALGLGAVLACSGMASAETDVIPVGTIKYNPAKAWNSYVILAGSNTAKLIDRNGNLVKEWDVKGGQGFPAKVFPGGHVGVSLYPGLSTGFQDSNTLAILDFDGNIVRQFNGWQKVDKGEKGQPANADGTYSVSRQHHDFQLEGSSTGYYAPGSKPKLDGKMLVLAHDNVANPKINSQMLLDDVIYIVDKKGDVVWKWHASDHFDQFGFTEAAKNHIKALPFLGKQHGGVDWLHINCASWLGPNKWYDKGDKRFHPDNIICDSRNSSHLFIIDHKTGDIVWQVTPPFVGQDSDLGPITGVHGTHMIPKGLPGAGNILIFDNGGPLPGDLYKDTQAHAWSRVIEFDPITKKIVWEYSAPTQKVGGGNFGYRFFFSPFISIAQRLPNGNTMITEGACSRIFEVTTEGEIVWEYRNPYNNMPAARDTHSMSTGYTYRAYAVPYDYVPQLTKPVEVPVSAPAFPRSFVMMPDDNGNLPNYKPVLDQRPTVLFEEPWVINRPAAK